MLKTKNKYKLLELLKTIPDFRENNHKKIYPLNEIIFMTFYGLLRGNTTYDDIHFYISLDSSKEYFKKLFKKDKIAIPSRSTLNRILINTDTNMMEKIFQEYFKPFAIGKNIAIDGKWLNGSDIKGQYTIEPHKAILNILDKDQKITIAHKFMDKFKRSEIPAFYEALNDDSFTFTDEPQIFSFDALLTQTKILNKINQDKNHYLAKVKRNHKNLRNKLIDITNTDAPIDTYIDKHYKTEGNRTVRRTIEVFSSNDCSIVIFNKNIDNVQSIIKLTKETITIHGEIKTHTEYMIANFKTTAEHFKDITLQHWRVETYHYHLDVHTKEDDHIAYVNPFVMSILRSIVINLYQLELNQLRNSKQKYLIDVRVPTMANIKKYARHSDEYSSYLIK